jgi:hypothetical protein
MSAKKFKFVSPGVFLSEIDNSQLPKVPGGVGPVVIGRTRRGPAMKPVKVNSFQEFVEIFGEPVPGNEGEDPWRDGNGLLATAYAPYAAQAYLRADINSPVTVIRLLGVQGDDASDAGHAGWEANNAFGIFVAPGIDGVGLSTVPTASLVGVIYGQSDALRVGVHGAMHSASATTISSGNHASGSEQVKAVNIVNEAFTISITDGTTTVNKSVSLREGSKYIRDRLNTSPVATNTAISTTISGTLNEKYWLGETFEETYEEVKRSLAGSQGMMVFTAVLDSTMADFKSANHELSAARSGWVIPQNVGGTGSYDPTNLEKLFRFHAIQEGEQGNDLHICIENIKIAETGNPNAFGRFDVVVKQKRGDKIFIVDTFESLNLNPNSDNFVARRIGDQYFEWDAVQKRNKVYGNYPNRSSYIRVEMGGEVGENGPDNPRSVPFGFLGPLKPKDLLSGDAVTGSFDTAGDWIDGTGDIIISGATDLRVQWPTSPHVTTGSLGVDLAARYVLGSTPFNRTAGTNDINHTSTNKGMKDYLRRFSSFSGHVSPQLTGIATNACVHSYMFSLDEVVITGASGPGADLTNYNPTAVDFVSGSQRAGTAYTALANTGSAIEILRVVDSFAMPLVGGFDGVDITEADPFNMAVHTSTRTTAGPDSTTRNSYAHASVDRALELIRDPEALEMNLAAMPGISNEALTTKLVQICEARADALAVIDLPDVYLPPAQKKCDTFKDRLPAAGRPAQSSKNLIARQLNSSYGATYYPWVKIRDTVNARDVWAPPSIVALGVMGYTEQRDEVWFAPAGFNRGGLNEGNAGIPVLQVTEQLLSSERDRLYEANINPIASFVSEGLVVFGQKTLQLTPSALDRINVRRLLIFVKKEVSRIANGLLFDQNVPATWNRFTGQVVPFLESVKTRLGLTDFKVVLDRTTTTPDLVDRNIMYAKIFLKPARAIEFIAVDFVITRSGASFDD